MNMWQFILPALLAFCTTIILTPFIIKTAKKYHLVDDPTKRYHPAQVHKGIIPRAGGLAVLVGLLVPTLLFLPPHPTILAIIAASCLTVAIGLLDDYRDVSPYIRIIANVITATIVVSSGIDIPFITNPIGGIIDLNSWQIIIFETTVSVWAILFGIIWIVWTMNIVGWSSGVDGQMPGFVIIAAIILGMLSLRFSAHGLNQPIVTTLAFITAGAFLGFLPWNLYPQKIMPGYGGKTLAGLLLAVISILAGGKVGFLLLLAVPMIDAAYVLFGRITHKKSPFKADRNHLHHRLLDLGWRKSSIAIFYWLVTLFFGIIALNINSQQKIYAILMAIALVGSILFVVTKLMHDHNENI